MLFFTDEVMRNLLVSSLETAELTPDGFRDVGRGPGSTEGEFIDWLTMKDNAAGVIADVKRIRNHPLIPKSIPIYGYVHPAWNVQGEYGCALRPELSNRVFRIEVSEHPH